MMLKRGLLILSGFALLMMAGSCVKDGACKNKSIDSERATIQAYAAANGIVAIEHSTGVFYEIINPGSGTTPSSTSNVSVKYRGRLLNGTIFDDQMATAQTVNLAEVIRGWQYGLPLIQEGGSIRLLIPSSLGYGCTGFGAVPEHSILYFEIELIDVL